MNKEQFIAACKKNPKLFFFFMYEYDADYGGNLMDYLMDEYNIPYSDALNIWDHLSHYFGEKLELKIAGNFVSVESEDKYYGESYTSFDIIMSYFEILKHFNIDFHQQVEIELG